MDAVTTFDAVYEDSVLSLMSRVVGNDAELITQAGVSGIKLFVWYKHDLGTDVHQTEGGDVLTVADVVFDTLQTDDRWEEDSTGYNFRHDLDGATYFTTPGNLRVEYEFTTASGVFLKVFEGEILDRRSG